MSILFFCIGGALAVTSCYAFDLFMENVELKKKYEETFNEKLENLDKKEE